MLPGFRAYRLYLLVGITTALPAGGQPLPETATLLAQPDPLALKTPAPQLADLVAEALARSPALAAARAEVAARREMESPAGELPDPQLETMLQNVSFKPTVGDEDMSMFGVEARQSLPYPGKRTAARALAVTETAAAAAEWVARAAQIRAEVTRLYAQIYALDREGEALAAASELAELLAAIAESRYGAGMGDQEGVLKAQIAGLRIAEQRGDVARERRVRVAELNRWLDRPGDAGLGTISALPVTAPIPADAERWAVAGSAEVGRAAAAVRVEMQRLEVARLHLKPDFSAGAGIATRGDQEPVVLLRFGVELPLRRKERHHPMVRAAELELEAARKMRADAEASARAQAAQLRADWLNADEQIVRYRDGILPQTSAALDAARIAYLAGRGDFSTMVEDFKLWLEARIALARREAARLIARGEFDRLAGTPESREE